MSQDDFVISSFVRYPPAEDLTIDDLHDLKLCISELDDCGDTFKLEEDDPFDARMLLVMKKGEFDRTKNPIVAMEAFVIAHQARIFPPMWALTFFAENFEEYHASLGEVSLDKVLGLSRGKGQPPAFKELINSERNDNIIQEAYRLCHMFDISREKAAYMVFRRIEDMNEQGEWNKTSLNIRALSEDTIRDLINRGQDSFNDPDIHSQLSLLPLDEKLQWIKPYPDDSIPAEIKKAFGMK